MKSKKTIEGEIIHGYIYIRYWYTEWETDSCAGHFVSMWMLGDITEGNGRSSCALAENTSFQFRSVYLRTHKRENRMRGRMKGSDVRESSNRISNSPQANIRKDSLTQTWEDISYTPRRTSPSCDILASLHVLGAYITRLYKNEGAHCVTPFNPILCSFSISTAFNASDYY